MPLLNGMQLAPSQAPPVLMHKGLSRGPAVQALCKTSGSTLGYGFPTVDLDDDDGFVDGASAMPLTVAVP